MAVRSLVGEPDVHQGLVVDLGQRRRLAGLLLGQDRLVQLRHAVQQVDLLVVVAWPGAMAQAAPPQVVVVPVGGRDGVLAAGRQPLQALDISAAQDVPVHVLNGLPEAELAHLVTSSVLPSEIRCRDIGLRGHAEVQHEPLRTPEPGAGLILRAGVREACLATAKRLGGVLVAVKNANDLVVLDPLNPSEDGELLRLEDLRQVRPRQALHTRDEDGVPAGGATGRFRPIPLLLLRLLRSA
mmetsp:Transcript_13370/g.38364  ORF Transcript_13370/g.38364 Transcript_13370/m.38364 type:complete len:240 (+) Transcript_13370:188-907(+)